MIDEKWIQNAMKTLDISREEAIEMWNDDHDIDAGKAKDFDLDPAKQKVVKEMTKAGGKARAKETKPRERKPNDEKREIIKYLAYYLGECDKFDENFAETVKIVNVEREITFKIGENDYSCVITCHRKPKK